MHTVRVSESAIELLQLDAQSRAAELLDRGRAVRRGANGGERLLLVDLDDKLDLEALVELRNEAQSKLRDLFAEPTPDDKSERIAHASRTRALRLTIDRCTAALVVTPS